MQKLTIGPRAALCIGILLSCVAACGGTGDGGGGGSGGSSGSGSGTTTSSGGDGCGMSFCGCWEDVMMMFDATVQDSTTMMPVAGIELSCKGEDVPIATSDAAGKLSFTIATMQSPGCGYERCNNMVLHAPNGPYMDLEGTYFTLNGQTILMK